ncbi:hypothetical protein ACIPW5_15040 [Streptomyces sp. NPDC090077]|uniref:hypothetical protein n=1 Tax=Streptomyces sp. NPDC090077 TaxID=3365938 RepID=UPI0038144BA0
MNAAEKNAVGSEPPGGKRLFASWPEPRRVSAPSPELLARARAGWERFVDSIEEDVDE